MLGKGSPVCVAYTWYIWKILSTECSTFKMEQAAGRGGYWVCAGRQAGRHGQSSTHPWQEGLCCLISSLFGHITQMNNVSIHAETAFGVNVRWQPEIWTLPLILYISLSLCLSHPLYLPVSLCLSPLAARAQVHRALARLRTKTDQQLC